MHCRYCLVASTYGWIKGNIAHLKTRSCYGKYDPLNAAKMPYAMLQKCPICCENALRRRKNALLLQECPKHVAKMPKFHDAYSYYYYYYYYYYLNGVLVFSKLIIRFITIQFIIRFIIRFLIRFVIRFIIKWTWLKIIIDKIFSLLLCYFIFTFVQGCLRMILFIYFNNRI